jgi:hypothetical protein
VKRLIAFIALLALGILVLKLAVGDEPAVRAKEAPVTKQKKPRKRSEAPAVRLQQGNVGTSVTQSGPLKFSEWREIDLGGSRVRKEEVFILTTKDSRPIGEGLQQLIDVNMELFDKGKHAATIIASDAFVELGRDANGNPTFQEQKKVELRNAVVTTEDGSQMAGVRLELGDATITVGDNEVQLTTEADQFVTVTIDGKFPVTLTGTGASARLPRNKNSGLQKASVTIQTNPVLTTKDLSVKASGRMHYVEDTVTGKAQISIDDNVQLDMMASNLRLPESSPEKQGDISTQTAVETRITGDQFTGWLLRNKITDKSLKRQRSNFASRDSMAWHRLVLAGAPARINGPGVNILTPRITVRTTALGDPYVVTAHGGESRIEQTDFRPTKDQPSPLVGVSKRRIHITRPLDSVGALHRSMGFPQWTLSPLKQQPIVIFEGASKLASGARSVTASDGFVLVRNLSHEAGVIQGIGSVTALQRGEQELGSNKPAPDLIAKGNDGMLLAVSQNQQRLQLGPAVREESSQWRDHRYSIKHGSVDVRGLGACEVTRQGNRTNLSLLAPHDQIEANFDAQGIELRGVRQLRATLENKTLTNLDVGGLPTQATITNSTENMIVQAPRIRQIGPRSLRLLPMDLDESPWSEINAINRLPRLVRTWDVTDMDGQTREQSIEVMGPRIDIHHAGGESAMVDAHAEGDELPRIYAKVHQPGAKSAMTVTCAAKQMQLLPFIVSSEVRAMHFGGTTRLIRDTISRSLASPWMIFDHVRDFQLDDEQQGHIRGTGDRLFISQSAAGMLFIGNPDNQSPAVVERTLRGRSVVMEGARVRISKNADVSLSALGSFTDRSSFVPPKLTMRNKSASGPLANIRAVCRGNIHIDPGAVRFEGPVEAHGLTKEGVDDPDGIYIDAKQLAMERQANTGEISNIIGKDTTMQWTSLDADAAEIDIDVLRGHCIASDPDGAQVELPDGRLLRSVRIFVNYKTWSFRTGPSRALQPSTPPTSSIDRK